MGAGFCQTSNLRRQTGEFCVPNVFPLASPIDAVVNKPACPCNQWFETNQKRERGGGSRFLAKCISAWVTRATVLWGMTDASFGRAQPIRALRTHFSFGIGILSVQQLNDKRARHR